MRNPIKQLHKIVGRDDLREAHKYAFVIDGFIYATDAHVAVKIPLQNIMDENLSIVSAEEAEYLEGRAFSYETLKRMSLRKWDVEYTKEFVVLRDSKGNSETIRYSAEVIDGRKFGVIDPVSGRFAEDKHGDVMTLTFPNIEAVMPPDITPKVAFERMSVNPSKLLAASSVFDCDTGSVQIQFKSRNASVDPDKGPTSALVLKANVNDLYYDGWEVILMPVLTSVDV